MGRNSSLGSIANRESLAAALDIELNDFENALKLPDADRYTRLERPKPDGSTREVYRPHYLIRKIQRRINHRIFSDPNAISWPEFLHGSIPSHIDSDGKRRTRDYITCAQQHCGAKSLLKVDAKNFFDNIHEDLVYSVFFNFLKYSESVSEDLKNICTYDARLVQGALTSSYIANLCLHDTEAFLHDRLKRKGLTYTRFVDDITISSKISRYDFSYALSIVEQTLIEKDLPINKEKTKIQYASTEPLTVHGLRINFDQPRLPADEVRKIRAAVKNIEIISKDSSYRMTHAYRHDFNRCMGRVNKLARVGHSQHTPLVRRLIKIYPLPSKKDIERAKLIVERLERDATKKSDSFWYARRFHIAHERLNILKRSYPVTAKKLREKLKGIKPKYE